MVKLWIGEHAQAVAEHAVDLIEQTIKGKPACVLGLATGSTPLKTYQEMIRRYREGRLDLSQVTTFNLDEYYGLDENHPQSYHSFMYENLFRYINIPRERITSLPGLRRTSKLTAAIMINGSPKAAGSTCSCWGSGQWSYRL